MPVYQIGVDISIAKSTTVLVRLEAEDEKEAQLIAHQELQKLSLNSSKTSSLLRGIKSYCWDEDYSSFEVEGTSLDDYPIKDYEADIDLTEEG